MASREDKRSLGSGERPTDSVLAEVLSAAVSGESVQELRLGQLGLSEKLRTFVAEYPHERGPILDFVMKIAASTAPGAAVLDLGAGDAPYRELFTHTRYVTTDWCESPHVGGQRADIVASAEALPVEGSSFVLVLCTQVLEHVPHPAAVLRECFRVLERGGRLALTVPLVWELHELPHDYYRYTEACLRHLLTDAGFDAIEVTPRSDSFSSLAQMILNLRWGMGDAPDGLTQLRIDARAILERLAAEIARLAPLDAARSLPLGYTATARRP
jgi:SAM-dependent methyltransferase